MISRVEKIVDGQPMAFRLGSRAMVSIERQNGGKSIDQVLSEQKGRVSFDLVVMILRECANDGEGISEAEAYKVADHLGVEGFSALLAEVVEAAFQGGDKDSGNA